MPDTMCAPFQFRWTLFNFAILILLAVPRQAMALCLTPVTVSSQLRVRALQRFRGSEEDHPEAFVCGRNDARTPEVLAVPAPRPPAMTSSSFPVQLHKLLSSLDVAKRNFFITISPAFYKILKEQAKHHLVLSLNDTAWVDPRGPRWAIAENSTDFSGIWAPVVTPDFKQALDSFLSSCGQPYLLRKLIVNALPLQREVIRQMQRGRELEIVATNPVGQWNRTLIASGTDKGENHFEPIHHLVLDPDGNEVQIEAWWEKAGTVHRSWLRGNSKVKGGQFETSRYLESQNVLVCESTFHPPDQSKLFSPAQVVWRYSRVDG